ncbi:hypothetical protein Ancab_015277 [Ancistrocladus abbreviatus]
MKQSNIIQKNAHVGAEPGGFNLLEDLKGSDHWLDLASKFEEDDTECPTLKISPEMERREAKRKGQETRHLFKRTIKENGRQSFSDMSREGDSNGSSFTVLGMEDEIVSLHASTESSKPINVITNFSTSMEASKTQKKLPQTTQDNMVTGGPCPTVQLSEPPSNIPNRPAMSESPYVV